MIPDRRWRWVASAILWALLALPSPWAIPVVAATTGPGGTGASEALGLFAGWGFVDSPGLSVRVTRGDRVVFEASFGLADLGRKESVGPSTVFPIASLTKTFTAMAIMMLAESGKLTYDDPVTRFVPELPDIYRQVTVRHLLTHTGGIPDYYAKAARRYAGRRPTNLDALRLLHEWDQLRFVPGTRYEYSNAGYELLAVVIERGSGETYADFLRRRVFEPLGMRHTRVVGEPDPGQRSLARGYSAWVWGSPPHLHEEDPLNSLVGAGGIESSLEDLSRWDQALYGGDLLPQETLAQAFRPALLRDGAPAPVGYGWMLGSFHGRPLVFQTGRWLGFRSAMFRVPEARLTVIILANHARLPVEAFAEQLLEIYAGCALLEPADTELRRRTRLSPEPPRPALDALWNATGYPEAQWFEETGVWSGPRT